MCLGQESESILADLPIAPNEGNYLPPTVACRPTLRTVSQVVLKTAPFLRIQQRILHKIQIYQGLRFAASH
jgi:hypothetical protein